MIAARSFLALGALVVVASASASPPPPDGPIPPRRADLALASSARDIVTAHRELVRITPPLRSRRIRVGPAARAAELLRWYGEAQNRFAYNPSRLYADAVLRYARQIGGDRHVFYELYSWQVYVRTRSGSVRVTGPGRQ